MKKFVMMILALIIAVPCFARPYKIAKDTSKYKAIENRFANTGFEVIDAYESNSVTDIEILTQPASNWIVAKKYRVDTYREKAVILAVFLRDKETLAEDTAVIIAMIDYNYIEFITVLK